MWLFGVNGLCYLLINPPAGVSNASIGRSAHGSFSPMQAALRGRLQHADLRHYNMVQRVAYLSVMILGVMSALSGLVLWKSVQFPPLRTLLGGYEAARYIHFLPCRRWWPSSRFTR